MHEFYPLTMEATVGDAAESEDRPAYDGFDPTKGGITAYPPGAKENCGIFLHTNPWMMIAETLVGRGNLAHQYYAQINPATRNDSIDEFEVEPYVYCQNILSDEHPQFGPGRNSWLTGAASWAYQAGMQYILGIRPTYAGLEIDPCIPTDSDGFRVHRVFRGSTYEIVVKNPSHLSKGVAKVTVDGHPITGTIVAPLRMAPRIQSRSSWDRGDTEDS